MLVQTFRQEGASERSSEGIIFRSSGSRETEDHTNEGGGRQAWRGYNASIKGVSLSLLRE